MNLQRTVGLLLMLLCTAHAIRAQGQRAEKPFFGKWDITATTPSGSVPYWLEVKMEGDQLVGYFLNRGGSVFKLPEISIKDDTLSFTVAPPANTPNNGGQNHQAKVEAGKLIGTLTAGGQSIKWTGVRPPVWGSYNANGKHKLGRSIELFDGTSVGGWEVQMKNKPIGWSVVEGVLTNDAKANNIVSGQKFKDFKIQAEYKLEPHSNSGIYLRGRYELQVLDDHGKEPDTHGHMGIYSRVKPIVNASLSADQWQTMEATLVGNRVTVRLNNKLLHDNVAIDGITGGALDADEAASGPIMLQGDHGKVSFRRITVTPITQ